MMTKEIRQTLAKIHDEQGDLRLLVNNLRRRVEDLELGGPVVKWNPLPRFEDRLKAAAVRGAALFTFGQRVRNEATYAAYQRMKVYHGSGHPRVEKARLMSTGIIIPRPALDNGVPTFAYFNRVWVLCDDKRVRYTDHPERLVRL